MMMGLGGPTTDILLLYLVSSYLASTAIMIHGGGFTLGNSAHIPYNQVNYFLDQGFAVCSIEYRMLPQ